MPSILRGSICSSCGPLSCLKFVLGLLAFELVRVPSGIN
jgi:hypothetical protein